MPAEPPKPDESINKVKVQQAQPLSPISTQPVPAPVPLPQSTTAQRPNISTQPPKTPQHNHEMPQQSLFPQGSFLNSLKKYVQSNNDDEFPIKIVFILACLFHHSRQRRMNHESHIKVPLR